MITELFLYIGKNRLYPQYSLSSSEPDDNTSISGHHTTTSHKLSSHHHPFNSLQQQHHPQQQILHNCTGGPAGRNIYNNPYNPSHHQSAGLHYNSVPISSVFHSVKQQPGPAALSEITPPQSSRNSDNISEDLTLTDTELALARDSTLLVHNGEFIFFN